MKLTDEIREGIRSLLTARPSDGKSALAPHRQKIGGGPKRVGCGAGLWPFKSDALGVNPDQISEAEAHFRAHGLTVGFDRETGAAILTGPKQYHDACRAAGIFTGRDGFGGVATGREIQKQREQMRRELA